MAEVAGFMFVAVGSIGLELLYELILSYLLYLYENAVADLGPETYLLFPFFKHFHMAFGLGQPISSRTLDLVSRSLDLLSLNRNTKSSARTKEIQFCDT
jgi:hypothetical protein